MHGNLTRLDLVALQLEKARPATTLPLAEYNEFSAYAQTQVAPTSELVERMTDRFFVPYRETKDVTYLGRSVLVRHAYVMIGLDHDLTQIYTLTINGTVIDPSKYRIVDNNWIYITSHDALWSSRCRDAEITVDALWAYTDNAYWRILAQSITGSLTAVATSINVGASASLYKVGMYLMIEDEILEVTAVDANTMTIVVRRGQRGTSANAYTDYDIFSININYIAQQIATRLTAWLYQKRNDVGDRVQMADGSVLIPSSFPAFLHEGIAQLKRRRMTNWGAK